MTRRRLACVLGEVDLVTALGLAGIPSAVVAHPGNPARYSRYAATCIEWVDPWRTPEALVARLRAFAAEQQQPPVLYYDGDWDVLLISRYRDQLSDAFAFVVPDRELVEDLVDKVRFQALAERLDLPVPRAVRLSAAEGDVPDTDLRFPAIAKPVTRQHETWKPLSAAKAVHLEDAAALRRLWPSLAAASVDTLVQETIPGPESRIESYHVYVDASGEIVGEFTGRKLRTYPTAYGYSTALTVTDSPEVSALGRDFAERLALRGVAKFDFRRDDSGRLHLLEVNPRFNLWHHPGALAGVNLPALVYADLVGLPRRERGPVRTGVRWCSLAHDHRAAREDGMPLARWALWALRCEAKSGFSLRDPFPLAGAVLWRLRRVVRTNGRRTAPSASRSALRDRRLDRA